MAPARLKVLCCKLKLQRLARPILLLKSASFSSLTGEMKETMQFLKRDRETRNFSAPGSRAKADGEMGWGGDNHKDCNSKP